VLALNAAGYDCLVAALPGASDAPIAAAPSPQQLVRALEDALPDECGCLTLLLHDWGCVYGMLLAEAQPQRIKRLIALDVGGHVPDSTFLLCLASYQWPLACAFALGAPVGDWMVRAMAGLLKYSARPLSELYATSGVHYLSFLRAGLHVPRALRDVWPMRSLARGFVSYGNYEPAVPTLFVYGTADKLLDFHSAEWEARVRRTPHGEVVAMASSHWLMVDKPDELNRVLLRWLAQTDETPRKRTGER
jgi:pimeloyl-ACP methyl ester carboxylesterase